jgi:cobalt-zinc-cadmium efflux system outer membrane protein
VPEQAHVPARGDLARAFALLSYGVFIGAVLSACARYTPRPLDLQVHPSSYLARRLDDPVLLAYVARYAGAPVQGRWTPHQLAVAALRVRSEVARARGEWRAAQAVEASARVRPQPGIQGDVERAVSASEGASPWVVSLSGLFVLELGGKRAARLQAARARTAVAESDLTLEAWRVVQEVRGAAAALVASELALGSAREEQSALEQVQELESQRFAEAALSSSELARTVGELQGARAAVASAARRVGLARAALAAALAVPPSTADAIDIASSETNACQSLEWIGPDSLATLALTRRGEVSRALASYARAEAEVRLQVARQYPDLELGPGFIWDQGVHRWTLALALPQLLAIRSRVSIREAEASRAAAAVHVAEAQDSILGEVGVALRGCAGARRARLAADSLVSAAERSAALDRAAYQRGETSRLEPAQGDLGRVRAGRLRLEAERELVEAGLALAAATGEWGGEAGVRWPDPRMDPDSTEQRR